LPTIRPEPRSLLPAIRTYALSLCMQRKAAAQIERLV